MVAKRECTSAMSSPTDSERRSWKYRITCGASSCPLYTTTCDEKEQKCSFSGWPRKPVSAASARFLARKHRMSSSRHGVPARSGRHANWKYAGSRTRAVGPHADESTGTIAKRFAQYNIENTEENRGFYRGLLFSTKGSGEFLSGAILFEETLFQTAPADKGLPGDAGGKKMVELLAKEGILPGIKVDKGLVDMWGTEGEKATQGLDGLAKRCADYYAAGARFAKWRAVLVV